MSGPLVLGHLIGGFEAWQIWLFRFGHSIPLILLLKTQAWVLYSMTNPCSIQSLALS